MNVGTTLNGDTGATKKRNFHNSNSDFSTYNIVTESWSFVAAGVVWYRGGVVLTMRCLTLSMTLSRRIDSMTMHPDNRRLWWTYFAGNCDDASIDRAVYMCSTF